MKVIVGYDRMGRPIRRTSTFERMMAKTQWEGECLVFTGTRPAGYGSVGDQDAPGGKILAHRLSWEHHHGPIPPGLVVRHKCDNPPCIRIEHLELGTYYDNMHDAIDRGRWTPTPPDANNRSTLVAEDVRAIRALVAAGARRDEVAQKFGISVASVHNIAIQRRWAHVV